jgi:hypothetical protein
MGSDGLDIKSESKESVGVTAQDCRALAAITSCLDATRFVAVFIAATMALPHALVSQIINSDPAVIPLPGICSQATATPGLTS